MSDACETPAAAAEAAPSPKCVARFDSHAVFAIDGDAVTQSHCGVPVGEPVDVVYDGKPAQLYRITKPDRLYIAEMSVPADDPNRHFGVGSSHTLTVENRGVAVVGPDWPCVVDFFPREDEVDGRRVYRMLMLKVANPTPPPARPEPQPACAEPQPA